MRDARGEAADSMMEPSDGTASPVRQLAIGFTGSGRGYFRIWFVNLLLTLVTLSLYYPWAKARQLRYFHGHTQVDGTPLAFHGNPRTIFRGYLLVAVLFGLYSLAGQVSAIAGLSALVLAAAIAPALFRSSMRFRLASTSWRGMRLVFSGSTGDAYRAMLPLFVTLLLFAAALPWAARPDQASSWLGPLVVAVLLVTLTMLPWLLCRLKRFQHAHYGLASLQTGFKATVGAFYALAFKTFAWSTMFALAAAAAGLGLLMLQLGGESAGLPQTAFKSALLLPLVMIACLVGKTYFTAALQNLVWTKTGNRSMRFVSRLRFSQLFWLTFKNWLLIGLTLGLYWPFAAVASARLRLESVTIKTRQDPAVLVSLLQASDVEAVGDAAGDLLGLDIGL